MADRGSAPQVSYDVTDRTLIIPQYHTDIINLQLRSSLIKYTVIDIEFGMEYECLRCFKGHLSWSIYFLYVLGIVN